MSSCYLTLVLKDEKIMSVFFKMANVTMLQCRVCRVCYGNTEFNQVISSASTQKYARKRIQYEFEERIDKSVLRVTVWDQSSYAKK